MTLRRHSTRPFEIKSVEDSGEFTGYGSVFGVKDSYGDIVIKGAFAKSLEEWASKGKNPKMLWQHRAAEPVGVWTSMKEDDHGLLVKGKLALKTARGAEAYELMKIGAVDGLSIGYSIAPMGLEYDKGLDAYLLKQLDLWEVSPVTFPANPDATIDAIKSAVKAGPKEFERLLRDAGLSSDEAKALMAKGFNGLRELRDEADMGRKQKFESMFSSALSGIRALRGEGNK